MDGWWAVNSELWMAVTWAVSMVLRLAESLALLKVDLLDCYLVA